MAHRCKVLCRGLTSKTRPQTLFITGIEHYLFKIAYTAYREVAPPFRSALGGLIMHLKHMNFLDAATLTTFIYEQNFQLLLTLRYDLSRGNFWEGFHTSFRNVTKKKIRILVAIRLLLTRKPYDKNLTAG